MRMMVSDDDNNHDDDNDTNLHSAVHALQGADLLPDCLHPALKLGDQPEKVIFIFL